MYIRQFQINSYILEQLKLNTNLSIVNLFSNVKLIGIFKHKGTQLTDRQKWIDKILETQKRVKKEMVIINHIKVIIL